MAGRRSLDRARIRAAVDAAAAHTSAPIVVAVAPFFIGNVERAAARAFDRLKVAHTEHRAGVCVFVVPARRQVIVLRDEAADAHCNRLTWSIVAAHIAEAFGRGDGTTGIVDGVGRLAHALSVPFPRRPPLDA